MASAGSEAMGDAMNQVLMVAAGDPRGGRTRELVGADATPPARPGDIRIIDGDGNFRPRRGNPTNLFDDITGNLSTIANHQHLDRITLIDQATGAVLAEYERAGAVWTRTR